MKLERGMFVIRKPDARNLWWVEQCNKARKNPGGVFIVDDLEFGIAPIFFCLNPNSWSPNCFERVFLEDRSLEEYM